MGRITLDTALEIISHEALVREAYRDSVGVWTWSIGLTAASGHRVLDCKDKPQPLRDCLAAFVAVLERKYAPTVDEAFNGLALSETQFAAALSFHFNTGAIGRASWVRLFREGRADAARAAMLNWRKPPEILGRRRREQRLFFDGRWSHDGFATEYPVRKPSYTPKWSGGVRVDVGSVLRELLGTTRP